MDTNNVLNRAYAHWFQDGLFEIGLGTMLIGVGTLRAIIHFAEDKSASHYLLAGGLLFFMFGMAFVGKYVIEAIKGCITYTHISDFTLKPLSLDAKTPLVFLAVFIAGGTVGDVLDLSISQTDQETSGVFISIVMGIFWGIVSTSAARRFSMKHFYVPSATFFGFGLGIGALSFGLVLSISLYYLSIDLALISLGCAALVRFLLRYEPVDLSGEGP